MRYNSEKSRRSALFNLVFLILVSLLVVGVLPGCILMYFEHVQHHLQGSIGDLLNVEQLMYDIQ